MTVEEKLAVISLVAVATALLFIFLYGSLGQDVNKGGEFILGRATYKCQMTNVLKEK